MHVDHRRAHIPLAEERLHSADNKKEQTHTRTGLPVSDVQVQMNTNPLKKGILTQNSAGIGAITDDMVRERAVELAQINSHSGQEISESDLDQARRELTGEPAMDPNEAILESAPESERWDPVHGST